MPAARLPPPARRGRGRRLGDQAARRLHHRPGLSRPGPRRARPYGEGAGAAGTVATRRPPYAGPTDRGARPAARGPGGRAGDGLDPSALDRRRGPPAGVPAALPQPARGADLAAGARAALYRERLHRFLAQYRWLFGPDGAVLHQGRSLSYRFACLAPFWLGALDGATPLTPGQTRRLASGVLRHFTERGAPDPRGLLPLGWYGEQSAAAQVYSSPGSPYAAAMGFLGLLLPAGHPVWTAPEEPLAGERADLTAALPVPGFLVHRTAADGLVRVLNHGSCYLTAPPAVERDEPHYARLAYSTRTGPVIGPEAPRIDNHLALLLPDGTATRRERIHRLAVTDRYAASWHRPLPPGGPVPGAAPPPVVSVSVPAGPWEIRVHGLRRPPGWGLREGGYALAAEAEPETVLRELPGAAVRTAPGANGPGLVSAVLGLHGWTAAEVHRRERANAFGHRCAVPLLVLPPAPARVCDESSERIEVVVGAVLLTGAVGGAPRHGREGGGGGREGWITGGGGRGSRV
ncbi:DUF2264 domain-containing protein [Kitasatospora sp. NPDC056808]